MKLDLPQPPSAPAFGNLPQWTFDPIALLTAGAGLGRVFQIRLWRPVVVGYTPDWNRAILGDLDTFRSRGSLSRLTPYLSGGVVYTDPPAHGPRRQLLNPHFHSRALAPLLNGLRETVETHLPASDFDALDWSSTVVRQMLNRAFFGGRFPDPLLRRFVAPLHRPAPAPMLRRPLLFRAVEREIAAQCADPASGSLAAALADEPDAVEELRVAIAAGYDTTAHTLAWALWHLAGAPEWHDLEALPLVIDEILRLYPAGWIGSRITHRDAYADGAALPAGTMVLYSPLLTHRDPALWSEPASFRPDRFRGDRPAWGFIPFAAGRRTCLGTHLARAMLRTALEPFCELPLKQLDGDPSVTAGITLRPRGPLPLRLTR